MCPPVIAAVAAFASSGAGTATLAGLTLASTGVGVAGALQSSKAAQASANYQGQLADINAANAALSATNASQASTITAQAAQIAVVAAERDRLALARRHAAQALRQR